MLLTAITSSAKAYLPYPEFLNEDAVLAVSAFFSFILSLGRKSVGRHLLFLIAIAALTAATLNRLVFSPTIGTLVAAVFAIIAIEKPSHWLSYKRLFLTPGFSLVISFTLSTTLYIAFAVHAFEHETLLFLAATLSAASTAYLAAAKLKLSPKIGAVTSHGIPLLALYIVLYQSPDFHFLITTTLFTVNTVAIVIAIFAERTLGLGNLFRQAFSKPELIVISYFAVIATLGALLLQLPATHGSEASHPFIDSVFTAMSAVSVTGLAVFDTGVDYTFAGQFIIVLLIQLGGLGIVSMSAWVLLLFDSGRLSLHHETTIAEMSGYKASMSANELIKKIFVYFASFELAGALILFFAFMQHGFSPGDALWQAIFTAISAFCNAGFGLQTDNLILFQAEPLILITISILIIAGGIAPLLALGLPKKLRNKRLSLQDKLSVATTVVLLVGGFLFFLPVEWSNSLNELSVRDKFVNAWFHSVSSRTAGFNAVNLTEMRDISDIVTILLMFIGGNPGSAAGGIKTVTAAVIFFAALSALRNHKDVRAFGRTISNESIYRAIAIACLGLLAGFGAFLILSLTQAIEMLPLLFETVSALGTVGLSLGATSALDGVGKLVIIFCMLAGRVGPMTFILLLMRRSPDRRWSVPKEDVYIS
jgi:trk system potassium uptake protein TrkH